jgi:hypothetical protein
MLAPVRNEGGDRLTPDYLLPFLLDECEFPHTSVILTVGTRPVTACRSFPASMRCGWSGRQLRRMFLDACMTEVAVACHQLFIRFEFLGLLIGGHLTHAQQAGALDPPEVKRWWDDLRDADAAGRFLAGFTAFIVPGKKV